MISITKFIALAGVLAGGAFAAPVATDGPITNTTVVAEARGINAAQTAGQATHYIAGTGSCGRTHNGEVEDIVALSAATMGNLANNNPNCGREVTVTYNGKTARGKLWDKCGGCGPNDVDLSNHMYAQLAPLGTGRINVDWSW
ncbi:hypothetical protein FQN54_000558 [Arachnomyces sp. PD_36]|nr:hypothetical protein FQN54_000558 [Arachnomyces sp. PD_36]